MINWTGLKNIIRRKTRYKKKKGEGIWAKRENGSYFLAIEYAIQDTFSMLCHVNIMKLYKQYSHCYLCKGSTYHPAPIVSN